MDYQKFRTLDSSMGTIGDISERKKFRLEITDHDDRILVKIVNDLDRNIYNIPLTIELQPAGVS